MASIHRIAKGIAEKNKYPRAYKYDLFYREFDNQVELLGLVNDPTYEMNQFRNREMLFPKKWVTLAVLDSSYKVF